MRPARSGGAGVRGFFLDGMWIEDPDAVRTKIGEVYKRIDAENRGNGVILEAVRGLLDAFCPPEWLQPTHIDAQPHSPPPQRPPRCGDSEEGDGIPVTLANTCTFDDFPFACRRMRS